MWAPLFALALAATASATPEYLQRAPRALSPHGGYQDRHVARQAAACTGTWNGTQLTGAAEDAACRWTVRYGRAGRWEHSVAANQDGVDAAVFPKMCPQENAIQSLRGGPQAYDEDCLFMTVYAPANATAESKLPVFVWIHGGAYTGGSASDAGFDGSRMAIDDGIVVVFLQYRLGVLGFLPPDGASTVNDPNLAVRDVVLALNTVKANIASVGGDPERVTVGGQSAGASLTRTLLGVPAAKGLFRGLILQSDPINYGTQTFENAANLRKLVYGNATLANCTGECLKNVSLATLLSVQEEVEASAPFNITGVPLGEVFRPQFNTSTLPVDPTTALFNSPANLAANVSALPVMLTYTRNESGYLIDSFIAGAQIANSFVFNLTLNRLFGTERAKAFLDSGAYPLVAGPDGMRTSLEISLTDAVWRCVSHAVAARYAAAGGRIYLGEWTEGTTYAFNDDAGGYCVNTGAVCHSDDIYPTFDSAPNATAAASANASALANDVRPLWAAFIKTGNPGDSWRAFTANSTTADVFNIGNEYALGACPAGLWGDKVKWDWQLYSNTTNSTAAPPASSSTPAGGQGTSAAAAGAPVAAAAVLLSVVLGAVVVLL
ncbi:alpha/beta-hydrolase [Cutaneotrichosporon oleaginosum]|uniref:Alpha/beta-hydrolase n=1 Tax=Cutaneotrichosporon oleaginosum TaxID=879819 RepID=A0A0J1BEM6_9TREE|nr:alpha/beta-hydrolase [Cutaneotrichosporon oleaginosum]KLT46574.1 alpha/beta-hydrolase [Cutaneotrichosporon oleaginosum]TXT15061.1 hypothetical protein COLE_01254 [Cutaneotrichosporon oleaginosum]